MKEIWRAFSSQVIPVSGRCLPFGKLRTASSIRGSSPKARRTGNALALGDASPHRRQNTMCDFLGQNGPTPISPGADMANIDLRTQEFHGKLNEFFPTDHPNSPWLLRLMLIRDDVHFEFASIHKDAKGVDDTWLRSYFLRRISVAPRRAATTG
jgi:hypothetical protein